MTNMLADRIQFGIMQAKKLDSSSHQEKFFSRRGGTEIQAPPCGSCRLHADLRENLMNESQATAAPHSATERGAPGRQGVRELGPDCRKL
jgi:hypothetical protein